MVVVFVSSNRGNNPGKRRHIHTEWRKLLMLCHPLDPRVGEHFRCEPYMMVTTHKRPLASNAVIQGFNCHCIIDSSRL